MASEHVWPVLGTIPALFGDALEVAHDPGTREIRLGIIHDGEEEGSAWLAPGDRDALRELLDRAAMPGQVSGKRGNHGRGCGCTPCKAEWPADGMNAVERAARDLIGIPDSL